MVGINDPLSGLASVFLGLVSGINELGNQLGIDDSHTNSTIRCESKAVVSTNEIAFTRDYSKCGQYYCFQEMERRRQNSHLFLIR